MELERPGKVDDGGSCTQAVHGPGELDVRAQLDRILTSAAFSVPERVRQFLIFVINETLSGRGARIKAYSVAIEVFGRDSHFDNQNDPVVRIEAGRLRRALERYYLLAGHCDPIAIDIPKGGYVPRFRWRQELPEPQPSLVQAVALPGLAPGAPAPAWPKRMSFIAAIAALGGAALVWVSMSAKPPVVRAGPTKPDGPSLIVKPFVNLSRNPEVDPYVAGIGEELLAQLARFKELTVFGRETSSAVAPEASAAQIRQQFGNRYVLEGGVRISDGKLRVTSRVLDAETSAIVWSETYDAEARADNLLNIELTIASKVATAIAQPYGIIFAAPPRPVAPRTAQNLDTYRCSYLFYQYRTVLDQKTHAETRDCLEQVTARYPEHATGWAMLSYLYLDEDRFQLNARVGPPTPSQRARGAADRAVQIDPNNVRALQALMAVLYFNKEPAEALRIGSRAYGLNPNDTELLGEFGSRVAESGDWSRGVALIEEAMARNPGHSGYYTGFLALAAFMQGDDARAVEFIRRTNLHRFSMYHFVAALIYARLGLDAETAQYRKQFLKLRPGFFENFDGELDRRNFNARDRAILTRGALLAGFPIR